MQIPHAKHAKVPVKLVQLLPPANHASMSIISSMKPNALSPVPQALLPWWICARLVLSNVHPAPKTSRIALPVLRICFITSTAA